MNLSNVNNYINIINNFYIRYHILISFSVFSILTIFFLYFGLIDENHKWLDGEEYIARSKNINFLSLNFLGLRDGFRPPLFPILLHFLSFFPLNLTILYKILNISFVVFIPSILITFSKKIKLIEYKKIFSLSAILYYFFLPNFFFIDFVYAELLTVILFNLQLFIIYKIYLNENFNFRNFIILAILFVVCFYLKANLILYGLIFLIFINKIFSKFKNLFIFGVLIILLLAPWFFYMYSISGSFKATNSQFTNRLQGMGMDTIGHGLNNLDTLHGKYIFNVYGQNEKVTDYYTLYIRNIDEKYLAYEVYGMDLKMQLEREKYSKLAVEKIFNYDPIVQIKYSLLKLPHLFGFSFRGTRDYIISIYSIITFLLILYYLKKKKYRIIVSLNLLVLLATIIQTLIYVPTLRYSIYYFNSSLVLYAILMIELYSNLIKKNDI